MKILFFAAGLLLAAPAMSQVLIHAHNDYQKPRPLTNAIENKVFSVEADVYLRNDELLVAHMPAEVDSSKKLSQMYLQPMIAMFKKNKGHITADPRYRVSLVIDIKEKGEQTIAKLIQVMEPLRHYFDRSKNPDAVQIILSGERGDIAKWPGYPPYIFFDGRPYENYDKAALAKVAEISDSYARYVNAQHPSDTTRIIQLAGQVHKTGKPLRLWAVPDNEEGWEQLRRWGVDIINTDKVTECRNFFNAHNRIAR